MLVRTPTDKTLAKYGLSPEGWRDIWAGQGYVCPVCGVVPPSGRTVIDHYHVRGWKKMPPVERRKYVRGVVCITCNHFILTRYSTPDKLRRAADYLERGDVRWRE